MWIVEASTCRNCGQQIGIENHVNDSDDDHDENDSEIDNSNESNTYDTNDSFINDDSDVNLSDNESYIIADESSPRITNSYDRVNESFVIDDDGNGLNAIAVLLLFRAMITTKGANIQLEVEQLLLYPLLHMKKIMMAIITLVNQMMSLSVYV